MKIHCLIYKKDFEKYKNYFVKKEVKDSFLFEFINIYENIDIYDNIFDEIKNNSKDIYENIKKTENFLESIKEIKKEF
jgi:hypothetical protein